MENNKSLYHCIYSHYLQQQQKILETYIFDRRKGIKIYPRTIAKTHVPKATNFCKESRKKILLLMAGTLRPNPPPPFELNGVKVLERWKKKFQKKFFFP